MLFAGEGIPEPEDLVLQASRRGEKSLRQRNLAAVHEVAFPAFPDPAGSFSSRRAS